MMNFIIEFKSMRLMATDVESPKQEEESSRCHEEYECENPHKSTHKEPRVVKITKKGGGFELIEEPHEADIQKPCFFHAPKEEGESCSSVKESCSSVKQYCPLCQWKKTLLFAGVLFVGVGLGYPLGHFNKKSNVENTTSNTESTINSDDAFLADYTDEKLSTIVTTQEADNKLNILESYRKTLEQNKNIIIERIENIKGIIQDGMEERLLAEEINNLSKEEEEILKYYEKTDQEYLDFLKKKEDMLILKNKIEKEFEETCAIAQKSEEEKEKIKNQMAIVKEKQKALKEKKARIKEKEN